MHQTFAYSMYRRSKSRESSLRWLANNATSLLIRCVNVISLMSCSDDDEEEEVEEEEVEDDDDDENCEYAKEEEEGLELGPEARA